MFRNKKDEFSKELLRIYREWNKLWRDTRNSGSFVEIEPYQRGFTRHFELRDDIKNRKDARFIQQALDLVNVTQYSRDGKFLTWELKTGNKVPRVHLPNTLTQAEYDKLSEPIAKWFHKTRKFIKHSNVEVYEYLFIPNTRYWLIQKVEPNIVTHHWIPDNELEARKKELSNKIHANNWWPKINKAMSRKTNHKEWRLDTHLKNKRGMIFTDMDIEE